MNYQLRTTLLVVTAVLYGNSVWASELEAPDLPPKIQVEDALESNLLVLNAHSGLKLEQANQRKWNSGNYEFNLRAGSSQRHIVNSGQKLKEWDVALERPLRLPNKVSIDADIGAASVARADYALGDAHHEAARLLLRSWFVWLREQAQVHVWQHQVDIYTQQTEVVDRRVQAGDAPKLELNIARSALAQARVSLLQASLRAQMAGNDLQRQFPAITLPTELSIQTPQAITERYEVLKAHFLDDNHELGMVQAQAKVQALMAERSRADQIPDPTVGLRYASEMGGNEKVAGVFLIVPISFGQRSATAQATQQQADIASDQAKFVRHRLQSDIFAVYQLAVRSFATYQQAHDAALAIRTNAELIAKAYRLGESSLAESLSARRIAQEATLSEELAQLDANEARYRLALDTHQLWAPEENVSAPQ